MPFLCYFGGKTEIDVKMKDEIIAALRTAYANAGLSDVALDGVASALENNVNDENGIDEAVKRPGVATLVRAFQSEADKWRGKVAVMQKNLDAQKQESSRQEPPKPDGQLAELLGKVTALEQSLKDRDAKAALDMRLSSIRERLKQGGSDNENILGLVMRDASLGSDETDDAAAARLKGVYDSTYKQFYGNGVVPPGGSMSEPEPKTGLDADLVARLRQDNLIPPEKKV